MRTALIGAGGNGSGHARGLAEMADVQVVAVADAAADKAEALATELGAEAYADHRIMLEKAKPDAVWISSPCWLHAEHAVECLRAGAHVMCEKPMALTLPDCDRMIAAAAENGVKLNIAQTTRYFPSLLELARIHRSGRCGRLVCATSVRMGYYVSRPTAPWRMDGEKSGGIALEWEVHEIDFVRSIGGDVSQVYARTAYTRKDAPSFLDHFTAILTFADGGYGNLEASQSCHLGQSGRFFVGTEGSAAMVGTDKVQLKTVDMDAPEVIQVGGGDVRLQTDQDADFVRALREDAPPPIPGEEGRANVEVALAIMESGETGAVVNLPL